MEGLNRAVAPGKEGIREEAEGLLASVPTREKKGKCGFKASGRAHW